jgi:hypothetical protein
MYSSMSGLASCGGTTSALLCVPASISALVLRHAASLQICRISVRPPAHTSRSSTRTRAEPASMDPSAGTRPLRREQPLALGTSSKSYGTSSTRSRRRRLLTILASVLLSLDAGPLSGWPPSAVPLATQASFSRAVAASAAARASALSG